VTAGDQLVLVADDADVVRVIEDAVPGVDFIQQELVSDLRALRRMEGEPDEKDFTRLHALIEELGSGSIKTAYKRFMALAEEVGSDVESDIHAYFFTIGRGVGGYNLDDRLRRHAAPHHVVEKTALRRSHRGLATLTHLIRDRSIVRRPGAYLWLTQDGPIVGLTVTFWTIADTEFRQPGIYIDGKRQELPKLEWSSSEPDTNLFMARHRLLVGLNDLERRAERLVNFHIWWSTEMHPTFELATTIADTRLFPFLRVSHDNRASAELKWQHEDDTCEVRELASSRYQAAD
jgi:hypothetical protein